MKPHYPTKENARLTSPFGWRRHPVTGGNSHHDGIDLAPAVAGTPGEPIYAVVDGEVVVREWNNISGWRLFIKHTHDNFTSVYLHLNDFAVKKGQKVKRGQRIGTMGDTGQVTGIHLHFGISTSYPVRWGGNGSFIDPEPYLKGGIKVDGYWGRETTSALQNALGTVVDGEIWGQPRNKVTLAIMDGVVLGDGGSPMVRQLQKKVGAKRDGLLGPETIRKTQKYLGTPVDGEIWKPSTMVRVMQETLNSGTF